MRYRATAGCVEARCSISAIERLRRSIEMRASGLLVGGDDHAVQARILRGRFEALRQTRQKPLDDVGPFHADDRVMRSGHADIRQIRRALGKNALVCGLHVRVRADDQRSRVRRDATPSRLFPTWPPHESPRR